VQHSGQGCRSADLGPVPGAAQPQIGAALARRAHLRPGILGPRWTALRKKSPVLRVATRRLLVGLDALLLPWQA